VLGGVLVLGLVPALAVAETTYVNVGGFLLGARNLQVRPRAMHIISNENLSSLRWFSWGGRTASGHGTDHSTFPSPGHSGTNPVHVQLQARKRCGRVLVYTTVRIHFTRGVPYRGQRHTETIAYGCPRD
jgi:hypothetical protein